MKALGALFFGVLLCTAQVDSSAGMKAYYADDYAAAVSLLKPLAEKGDANSQAVLGSIYESAGKGVSQDFVEAAKWYDLASRQGNPLALYNLALLYEFGKGVRQDFGAAIDLYRKSSEQGNPWAQYNLALHYKNGTGVAQDYAEALRLLRLAADRFPAAQAAVGLFYDLGLGVPQDYDAAVRWYRKSAEQGEVLGQLELGIVYRMGQGVSQDLVQAHMWLNLASAQGNAEARKIRDEIAAKMTPAQIAEAQRLAREFKAKAQ